MSIQPFRLLRPLRLGAAILLAAGLGAGEAVPSGVAAILRAVAELDPTAALARLAERDVADHPLLWCARGQALQRLERPAEAEAAYRRCLALAPGTIAAHAGLAQLFARAGAWRECLAACGAAYDPVQADAAVLRFWIGAAVEAGDAAVASHLLDRAIPRFPGDAVLRQLELRSLLQTPARRGEALACAEAIVAEHPEDATLWTVLADLRREAGDRNGGLAALEAAYLVAPGADALRRLAAGELAEGRSAAAWQRLKPAAAADGASTAVLLLAAQAAAMAEPAAATGLLARIPPTAAEARSAALLQARLTVERGDVEAAWACAERLLSAGEQDAQILLWAGSVADRRGDLPRAEACYRAALAQTADLAPAQVRLASLLDRTGRGDEARTLLAAARERHPGDPGLEAMSALLR